MICGGLRVFEMVCLETSYIAEQVYHSYEKSYILTKYTRIFTDIHGYTWIYMDQRNYTGNLHVFLLLLLPWHGTHIDSGTILLDWVYQKGAILSMSLSQDLTALVFMTALFEPLTSHGIIDHVCSTLCARTGSFSRLCCIILQWEWTQVD